MTYMLELLVIVPLVFSFNAVLPLIPLIIIIILIAAAAGMTRGFSIFAFFGLDALMGVTQGTGGGRAGKGVRSVNYNRSAGPRSNASKRVPRGLVTNKLKKRKLTKQDTKIRAMKEAMGKNYDPKWRTKRSSVREGNKELKKTTKEYNEFLSNLKKTPSKMAQTGSSTKYPNTTGAMKFATSVLGSSFILSQNNSNKTQAALAKDYVKNKSKEYYKEVKEQERQQRPLAVLKRRKEARMRDLKLYKERLEELYKAQNQKIPPSTKLKSNGLTQDQIDEVNKRMGKATFFAKHSFLGTGAEFYRTAANTILNTQDKMLTQLYGKDYDSKAKGLINMVATGNVVKSSLSQKDQELYDLYKTYDLDKGGTSANVINHMYVGGNYNPDTKTLSQQVREDIKHNMFHPFKQAAMEIGYKDKRGSVDYKNYYKATYGQDLPSGIMTSNKYYFDLVKTIKADHTPPPLPIINTNKPPNVIRVMNTDDNGNPMYRKNGNRVETFLVENHTEDGGVSYGFANKEQIESLRKYELEHGNKYLEEKYKNDKRSWHDIVYGIGEKNSNVSSEAEYDKEGSRKLKTGNYNDRRERDIDNGTTFNYNKATYENAGRMDMYNIKENLLKKNEDDENILKSHTVLSINKDKNNDLITTDNDSSTPPTPNAMQKYKPTYPSNDTKGATDNNTEISQYSREPNAQTTQVMLYTNIIPFSNSAGSESDSYYSNNGYSHDYHSHTYYSNNYSSSSSSSSNSTSQSINTSQDPYSILGIERDSSYEEIRRAYHKLALKYHPDVHSGRREEAEEKFKKIANAYEEAIYKNEHKAQ